MDKELVIKKHTELDFKDFGDWLKNYLQDDDVNWGCNFGRLMSRDSNKHLYMNTYVFWVRNGKGETLMEVKLPFKEIKNKLNNEQ